MSTDSGQNSLAGKRAIVTGGSRGIGLAIAQALVENGASVVVCGRDQHVLDSAAASLSKAGKANAVRADVSRLDDVKNLFATADRELGGLDILVNNAGVGVFKPAAELSIEDWHRVVDTNLTGAFYCCHEALPRFKGHDGYIVNISSLAGKNPFLGGAAYNASKFGLNGLSEAVMLDHRYDDVRVSYVMPGSVDTEFGSHTTGASWKISPDDIAEIVLMLLKMPARTMVSRVEVRPSKPKK